MALAAGVLIATGCAHHRNNNCCTARPAVVGSVPIAQPAPPCCNGTPGVPGAVVPPPGTLPPPPPPGPFGPTGKVTGIIVPQQPY
jgi:hypothetical protein